MDIEVAPENTFLRTVPMQCEGSAAKHHGGEMKYEAPTVRELGSLRELTLQNNKIGTHTDMFTASDNLVGSIVPAQP